MNPEKAKYDAGFKDRIGYNRLAGLYKDLPNGSLSSVMQGDAGMPDVADPEFEGKTLKLMDAPHEVPEANAHATRSLRRLCGKLTSIVPAVARTRSYTSSQWLRDVLRMESDSGPLSLSDASCRVISHSWYDVDGGDLRRAIDRMDAMIDRDGVLQVIAAANALSELPGITNAYNAIVVGKAIKESSLGPTRYVAPGRCKPDIIAPLHSTSQATPGVGSAVVLLAESAVLQNKGNGAKPYVVKSVLMTGAEKLPRDPDQAIDKDWQRGKDPSAGGRASPLDFRQGAGLLRIDRSYAVLQRPESKPEQTAGETGWACGCVKSGSTDRYPFTLNRPAAFTATLVWHRHITRSGATEVSLLNNLGLFLFPVSSGAIAAPIDCSVSTVDNVQHLHLASLPAGAYVLAVVGTRVQAAEAYGLSWLSE